MDQGQEIMDQGSQLPSTCPTTELEGSQGILTNKKEPWGYLRPLTPLLKILEMSDDLYQVGRSAHCDVIFTNEHKPKFISTISKVHFQLRRVVISNHTDDAQEDYVVYLDDLSSNGTFVNGTKVGQGENTILGTNDIIAISLPHYQIFIYECSNADAEVKQYPADVRSQYAVQRKLGAGACGEVRLVYDKKTKEAMAMKIVEKKRFRCDGRPPNADEVARTQREVDILRALDHPLVIRFNNVIASPERVFIVTEYVRGGELFERLKKGALAESTAQLYFLQLAMAIQYLHGKNIIHRDVKLENILMYEKSEETLIKLSDFGLSKFIDSEAVMMTYCGSPMYMAPEVLKSRGRSGTYNWQADVWSMGVVLYMCLSGIAPFILEHEGLSLTEQILTGRYAFPRSYWRTISPTAVNLVKRTMTVNPARRITVEQILQHKWLKVNGRATKMKLQRLLNPPKAECIEQPPTEELDEMSVSKKRKFE